MPTGYHDAELVSAIRKSLGIADFTCQIEGKSLDARKKSNIHWLLRIHVVSDALPGPLPLPQTELTIPFSGNGRKVVITGSGPAGFFSALILQKAGFKTFILERGADVRNRANSIMAFERTGRFDPAGNYAFGEGGAGTFSDGKLTARTKKISLEKQFILSSYMDAGAPKEIAYMTHPHLGSDNLRQIVINLRKAYEHLGGTILFNTRLQDLVIKNRRVVEAVTDKGGIEADVHIIAPGHSAYDTYAMLIHRGVLFRTKHFAIGSRVEHPQELINLAQWGKKSLPGVKAAEYRLTHRATGSLPVYTFCMCPGGIIVPATPYPDTNIVNGMSRYLRRGKFANAACVAGVDPDQLLNKKADPLEILDWLKTLEQNFYDYSKGYAAPGCRISDFLENRSPAPVSETSYPLGLTPAPLWELLPDNVGNAMRQGLINFSRKLKGFDTGTIMGLESKTSAPVQAVREPGGLCAGFTNLYIAGEGSGYSGGIISSGADGIKTALHIVRQDGDIT